jgi:3-deoxy-D-manno-octulosonate 8-phosphate phosphatase (KDO 8-P phosphatase)
MTDRINALLRPVRLLAMDVDGVLTDGTLGIDDTDREQKRFHVSDGLGLTAIRLADVTVAWLSGRSSPAVDARAAELRIPYVIQGVRDKGSALRQLSDKLGLSREAVAFIGDDWNDLLAFESVGVRIAVGDADELVRQAADFVTQRIGGRGAVREVCNALLEARGVKDDTLSRYLATLREASIDGSSGQ